MSSVTSATEWKKGKRAVPLTLPSGNVCMVRRPGMEALLAKGMVPNSLLPIVEEAFVGARKQQFDESKLQERLKGMVTDPAGIAAMLELSDAVVIECVIEPKVHPTPADEKDRSDDVLYVDEVDMSDKMFIFQWAVGGSSDLGRFRQEQTRGVEALLDGQDVVDAAQSAGGAG